MALRDIVKDPNPTLRKKCRPVEVFDGKLGKLIDDMRDTMIHADGVGPVSYTHLAFAIIYPRYPRQAQSS